MPESDVDPKLLELIQEYIPMAKSIAKQEWEKAPQSLDLSELISLAYLGLTEATKMWAPYCAKNGFSPTAYEFFKPYCQRRARGKILDTLRAEDHVQRSVRTKAKSIAAALAELQQAGEAVSEAALAAKTDLSVTELRSVLVAAGNKPVSIDADPLAEHVSKEDVAASAIGNTVEERIRAALVLAVRKLSPAEQAVLALHYVKGLEIREVAEVMDITESRAGHLHTDAVLAVHAELERVALEATHDRV